MKIEEVFQDHYDVPLNLTVGNDSIMKSLMTKEKFVEIVSKMMLNQSNGLKHKTIEELHDYYEIGKP